MRTALLAVTNTLLHGYNGNDVCGPKRGGGKLVRIRVGVMDYTKCCVYFCVSFYPKLGAKQTAETSTAKPTYVISS
jgi:hypothetical protein